MPVMDAFWGDRYGKRSDPFGHQWSIATHKHDYTPEQIAKNAQEFFANTPGCDTWRSVSVFARTVQTEPRP